MIIPTSKPPLMINFIKSIAKANNVVTDDLFELPRKVNKYVFNFDYPLTSKINKEDFQTQIIEKYISRRIGFETFTMFQFALRSKMREIMPKYNILFDSLSGWDLFNDGEITTRETNINHSENGVDIFKSEYSNKITNDSKGKTESKTTDKQSDTPQSEIDDVKAGKYLSFAGFSENEIDATNNTESLNDGRTDNQNLTEKKYEDKHSEKISRNVGNKIDVYRQFMLDVESIYTSIYKELDVLFYGLI